MNKFEKTFDGKNLGDNGFPCSPKCGGNMSWENDFDAEELCYGIKGVVSVLSCSSCGITLEAENRGNEYILLNTSTRYGRMVHTEYGKKHL